MADIVIEKGRFVSIIYPRTKQGTVWLRKNRLDYGSVSPLTVPNEDAFEFSEVIKKDGLEVEIK